MTMPEPSKLPPVVCTLWCTDGDGHTDTVFPEDQHCWGRDAYVDLSLEPTVPEELPYVPRISAQAYRQWAGAAPCVYVHLDGIKVPFNRGGDCLLDDSVKMTADEACQLALALLKAAEDVRGPRHAPGM
jgi:hypothetical protein